MKKQKKTIKEIKESIKNYKNLTYDKETELFTVQFLNGNVRNYRTLNAAINRAKSSQKEYIIPKIITANTYFWIPMGNARSRREFEKKRNYEIKKFCSYINKLPGINVDGKYEESCQNVYKKMFYSVNNKKTNLTGIINTAAKYGLILLKQF